MYLILNSFNKSLVMFLAGSQVLCLKKTENLEQLGGQMRV